MKISAFSMCRNADKLYYPIEESIRSVLPIVGEFVIAVGKSDPNDRTRELLRELPTEKLRIIETEWDTEAYPNGMVHAQQTDLAKSQCSGDWVLYLQADEVIHEDDHPLILDYCDQYLDDQRVEGFLFQYSHFWGDYKHVVRSHGWYPKEIRLVRNKPEIHSWESAQSFRVIPAFDGRSYRSKEGTRKLRVIETPIRIFHYGWVRPPFLMTDKMNRLDEIHSHKEKRYSGGFNYGDPRYCELYEGSHPAVMQQRIQQKDWDPWAGSETNRPLHKHERLKNRVLTWIERLFFGGKQILGFDNYDRIA